MVGFLKREWRCNACVPLTQSLLHREANWKKNVMRRAEFHYLMKFLQCKHVLLFSFVYYKNCNKHLLFYPENFKFKGYTKKMWDTTLVGKQRNWNPPCDFTCRREGRCTECISCPFLFSWSLGNLSPHPSFLAGHQENEAISAGQSHSRESHKCNYDFLSFNSIGMSPGFQFQSFLQQNISGVTG